MDVQTEDSKHLFPTTTEPIPKLIELQPITDEWCTQYCSNNVDYAQKLKDAVADYSFVRVMNADGNCFYRAMLIAIMEMINNNFDESLPKYTNLAKIYYDDLLSKGYPEITVSDFYEIFVEMLTNIPSTRSHSSSANLMSTPIDNYINKVMQDSEMINYSFVFMRLMLSCYLQNNTTIFECFLTDGMTVDTFCKHHVEPIEIYCDDIQIHGLVKLFDVNISILSSTPNNCYSINSSEDSTSIDLYILYNNSHYDILYK